MGDFLHRTTKQYLTSVAPDSLADPIEDYIEDPDLSSVIGISSKYWIITGDVISEMNQAEKDAVDAAGLSTLRDTKIQQQVDDIESILRQVVILTVNELNDLRQWIVDFKVEVAAAGNLGNFQSRVATLPDMPDRLFSQVKTQLRDALGS